MRPALLKNKKLGIIGCGHMGVSIIEGLLSSGLVNSKQLLINDIEQSRLGSIKQKFKVNLAKSNAYLVKKCNIIILAVKPQSLEVVLNEIRNSLTLDKLLISIAAGITTKYIEKRLIPKIRVVRVMPNTAALVQEAMSLICQGNNAGVSDLKLAQGIFSALGQTGAVEENLLDAVTVISGCGPAYYFYLSEILINLANEYGLNKTLAQKMVKQTILGSAKLINKSDDDIQSLRNKVTSKGGVTEAVFKILEKRKIKEIFKEALFSGLKRSKELSR